AHPPTDTTTATVPLLAEVDEPADEDVVEVLPPSPFLAPPFPVADRPASIPVSATGDEGSLEALPMAPASGIAGGRQGAKIVDQDGKPLSTGEQQTGEPVEQEPAAGVQSAGEQQTGSLKGELSAGEESTNSDVVEVPITKPELRRTVKEALASWKGEAVRAGMGTREPDERPRGLNIMKNRWVLPTKYRIDDTVEREKARLVVKGFTQVCGADYDETYSPVSSYVALRIFLSIVAILDLSLMQLDMKNAFLQSKLDKVLYMYQPDYFDDGTDWASDDGVTCWVLVYVNDLLAASSSPAMLKELKGLLEAALELGEISPVVKYLGLEIVRDRPARKLWLHQQGYADKLRRRFIDKEQGGRVPKMPVSVDAYANLTFDDEEVQEREEEYQHKVGSLQFAAATTRPDIAFACSKLGSGLTVRSNQHWREVDRYLAYLADTRNTALEFGGGPESLEMIGYVDADDAGDKQNRTSMGGYVFVYGGAAVSWSSSRIKCATLSSTELEYVATTDAGKEGRRLPFLLAEFKLLGAGKPTILRVDNKSAITATQRSSQGYTFSLGSGSVSWRSTRSSSVLSSSCEAEIYAGAMAAQELRWLTYLLTDLGEQPRSPPVLYVDNKAMLALCREHRLEHRTKHIALRYFLARELQ
ncbi:unnamed protein product, partial [Closterium sp. NIES-53]